MGVGAQLCSQGTFCPWRRPANQACGGKVLSAFQGGKCGFWEQDHRFGVAGRGGQRTPVGTANSLTGHPRGSSGGVRRLTGFLPQKSILGRATPLLTQTRGDEGLGGRGVRRGESGKRPAQAARPLQRRSAAQGAGPTALAGAAPVGRGPAIQRRQRRLRDSGRGRSLGGPTSPLVAVGLPAPPALPPGEAAASSASAGSPS